MPSMTGMVNRPKLSDVITPTVKVRPLARLRAEWLGWKSSAAAASCTLARVSGLSCPTPLSALDTVPGETPASLATSLTVAARLDSVIRLPPFGLVFRKRS